MSILTGKDSPRPTFYTTDADKWDERWMEVVLITASWSKDPRRQVGCIIVGKERNQLSGGYNGFAREVRDTPERIMNQEMKRTMTVHAEANAIADAARNGRSLLGGTAYINSTPCSQCAALLIQAGIKEVVFRCSDEVINKESWAVQHIVGSVMFAEAGVGFRRI